MKQKTIYTFISSCCAIVLLCAGFASCSKDLAIINIDDIYHSYYDTIFNDINLNAKVEPFITITRANNNNNEILNLSTDAFVHIYAYKLNDSPDENKCFAKSIYKVRKTGKIIPIHDNLRLTRGIYNFYVLSVMNATHDKVPDFTPYTGISNHIYNGNDYVWGVYRRVEIKDSVDNTIDVILKRCCCNFIFEFNFDSSTEFNNLISAEIEAPTEKAGSWSISTGIINPPNTHTDKLTLSINNNNQAIGVMLPFETSNDINLSFILANDKDTEKKYDIKIPPQRGGIYQWGYSYKYSIVVNNNVAYLDY